MSSDNIPTTFSRAELIDMYGLTDTRGKSKAEIIYEIKRQRQANERIKSMSEFNSYEEYEKYHDKIERNRVPTTLSKAEMRILYGDY